MRPDPAARVAALSTALCAGGSIRDDAGRCDACSCEAPSGERAHASSASASAAAASAARKQRHSSIGSQSRGVDACVVVGTAVVAMVVGVGATADMYGGAESRVRGDGDDRLDI